VAPRRRALLPLLVALSLPSAGCSWAFLTRAPEPPVAPQPQARCTRGKALPIVDTAISAGTALEGGLLLFLGSTAPATCAGSPACVEPVRGVYYGVGAASLAVAVLTGISAAYGYSEVGRCRETLDAQVACLSGLEDSCRKLLGNPAGTN
jgi:hypothetical protein